VADRTERQGQDTDRDANQTTKQRDLCCYKEIKETNETHGQTETDTATDRQTERGCSPAAAAPPSLPPPVYTALSDRPTDRLTDTPTGRHLYWQGETCRRQQTATARSPAAAPSCTRRCQTDGQTERQAGRQAGRPRGVYQNGTHLQYGLRAPRNHTATDRQTATDQEGGQALTRLSVVSCCSAPAPPREAERR
jgi:hypothetical protein